MKSIGNKVILLAVLIFLSTALFYHFTSNNPTAVQIQIAQKSEGPSFENFSFTSYAKIENGMQKNFTISGKKVGLETKKFGWLSFAPVKVVQIKDARVAFYKNNILVSFATSKKAVLDMPLKEDMSLSALMNKVEFYGNVTMTTPDHRSLTCDRLNWGSSEGRLFASGNCIINYGKKSVKADSVNLDTRLKNFSFKDDNKKRLRLFARAF